MGPLYSALVDYYSIPLIQTLIIFFFLYDFLFPLLQIWTLKLHRKKVTHVEFNSRCEWLLATASVDQTVKIWDLRKIKNKMNFLHLLSHDKPVSAGELRISLHGCLQKVCSAKFFIVVEMLAFTQIQSCAVIGDVWPEAGRWIGQLQHGL